MADMEKTVAANEYNAAEIQVLEGLEAVRKRPGMYIGSTSASGLHHLVYEIVDNAIDEALAGYCDHIEVKILKDNIIQVTDNGRGIPVDIQADTGLPAVTVVYTILHAGGKFGGENSGYKVAGGLHGVGASVVNACSEWLTVNVRRDGKEYEQTFRRGDPDGDLKCIGTVAEGVTGTRVTASDKFSYTGTGAYSSLSTLTYVPTSGYSGTASIAFSAFIKFDLYPAVELLRYMIPLILGDLGPDLRVGGRLCSRV